MDEDSKTAPTSATPLDNNSSCPNCGESELWRESVDVGVGIMYGPFGCDQCGWSEDEDFDSSQQKAPAPDGWYAMPQGSLVNIERERGEIDAGLARFGLPPLSELVSAEETQP